MTYKLFCDGCQDLLRVDGVNKQDVSILNISTNGLAISYSLCQSCYDKLDAFLRKTYKILT